MSAKSPEAHNSSASSTNVTQFKKAMKQLYIHGKYQEAISAYRRLLSNPTITLNCCDRSTLLRNLAQNYFANKNYGPAIEHVQLSLVAHSLDEKSYSIGLKAAAANEDWRSFSDFVIESLRTSCIDSELLQKIVKESKIPEQYHLEIVKTVSKEFGLEWTSSNPKKTAAEASKETKPKASAKPVANGIKQAPSKSLDENKNTMAPIKISDHQRYLDLCKTVADAHVKQQRPLHLLEELLGLTKKLPDGRVSALDVVLIKYLLCDELLETFQYKKIAEAIGILEVIVVDNARILPILYATLTRAFLLLNRFEAAKKWLAKGNDFVEKGVRYPKHHYPETLIIIEATKTEFVVGIFQKLTDECGQFHPPDAVCCYDLCEEQHNYHILPSKDIFYRDPDFEGYAAVTCSDKCELRFHPVCWRTWKIKLNIMKKTDQQVLGSACLTPDCVGVLHSIKHIGKDFEVKQTIYNTKNSEPRLEIQSKQKLSAAASLGQAPTGDAVNQKEGIKNKEPCSSPMKKARSNVNGTEHVTEIPSTIKHVPSPPVTKSRKIQTEEIKTVDKYAQTSPDASQQRLRTLEVDLAIATKKSDKLREKYLTLKDRENVAEANAAEMRNEMQAKNMQLWVNSCSSLFNNWFTWAEEKMEILKFLRNNVSHELVTQRIDAMLQEWQDKLLLVQSIMEEFQRESTQPVEAHVCYELPDLPEYPKDEFSAIDVIKMIKETASCPSPIHEHTPEARPQAGFGDQHSGMQAAPQGLHVYVPQSYSYPVVPNGYESMQAVTAVSAPGVLQRKYHLYPGSVALNGMETVTSPVVQSAYQAFPGFPDGSNQAESIETTPEIAQSQQNEVLNEAATNSAEEVESNNLLPPLECTLATLSMDSGDDEPPCLPEYQKELEIYQEMEMDEDMNGAAAISLEEDKYEDCEQNDAVEEDRLANYLMRVKERGGDPEESSSDEDDELDGDDDDETEDEAGSSTSGSGISYSTSTSNRFQSFSKGASKNPPLVTTSGSGITPEKSFNVPPKMKADVPKAAAAPPTPTRTKPQASNAPRNRNPSMSSLTSLESTESSRSSSQAAHSNSAAQYGGTYAKLLNYLYTQPHFSHNSEDQIRRALEAIRKENRMVFKMNSLPQILEMLNAKLLEHDDRRCVLHKFTDLAWANLTPEPRKFGADLPLKRTLGDCSICLDSLNGRIDIMTLKCTHVFHADCLRKWLKSDHSCPLCREYVITHEEFPALK